jgi:hypothetical protein
MRQPGSFDRELRSRIQTVRHPSFLEALPWEQSRRHKICLYTREKRSAGPAAHGISRIRSPRSADGGGWRADFTIV